MTNITKVINGTESHHSPHLVRLLCLLCLLCLTALSPENRLPNESAEQRAMNLFLQVRCLVCNGQVIENSDTEFSFEMRKNIRQKIADGKSDEEIKEELTQEFGADILTKPSKKSAFLLFALPIFGIIFGLIILGSRFDKIG